MTLEFSLRHRARRAKGYAAIWLAIAVAILVGTYFSLPSLTAKTLEATSRFEVSTSNSARLTNQTSVEAGQSANSLYVLPLTVLLAELGAVFIGCFLLCRMASIENETAVRLNSIADALCLSGDDFVRFEKSVALLVPKTRFFAVSEFSSKKDLQEVLEMARKLRP